MKRIALYLGLSAAALLSACGGGGGSAGDTQLEYHISLRADEYQLPVNIANEGPGTGTYSPYTTVLYVNATEGGSPIPGGEDIFSCNLEGGLNVGALYYLDGDDDHMTELEDGTKVPSAYLTLGSNAGGNSFHFHAGPTAGTARITCSVTNPRDNQLTTATVEITVGSASGVATGRPASVNVQAQSPYYLGTQGNTASIRNTVALQAQVRDETNQWVTNPSVPNLQVAIVGTDAANFGARLTRGSQSGTVIQTATSSGIADFMLHSGAERGVILLRLTVDRADNNVSNGVQDGISQLLAVPVVRAVATTALEVADQAVKVTCNKAVTQALVATGGVPPYRWTALGALPAGLTLTEDGVVTGVPSSLNGEAAGTYTVAVNVTDYADNSVTTNVTFTIEAGTCQPLAVESAEVSATVGTRLVFALTAVGGQAPYTWRQVASSGPFSVDENGILTGTATAAGTHTLVVEVTDSAGTVVRSNVTITVE